MSPTRKGKKKPPRRRDSSELTFSASNLAQGLEKARDKQNGGTTVLEHALLSLAASQYVIAREMEKRNG
jgi:hypothetical protein